MNVHVSPSGFPALVLNADFRPLSYYPLSLWCWQDAIKAVFLERVNIVAEYERAVRSPSIEMKLPSVVSLKTFVKPAPRLMPCARNRGRGRIATALGRNVLTGANRKKPGTRRIGRAARRHFRGAPRQGGGPEIRPQDAGRPDRFRARCLAKYATRPARPAQQARSPRGTRPAPG